MFHVIISEMGIIVDTKAEEVAQTDLQPTCNNLATDVISRQAAIEALDKRFDSIPMEQTMEILRLRKDLRELPSAQPERKTDRDAIDRQERQRVAQERYTFGNDEFSLEAAYHDCKLVFDGITDDDSFQEADTGLILYYANEIIYALQEALHQQIGD